MRVPDNRQNEATRQALLAAAAPIFARDGYQIARIRDIAAAASVNLSAINYHFGSKQGLYEAVLANTTEAAITAHPLIPEKHRDDPVEVRFHILVANMLARFVDVGQPSLMAKLMVREMANPTTALDVVIDQVSKPQFAITSGLIAELLGPAATEQRVRHCTLSLLGQVVFYLFARPLVNRLFPITYDPNHIQQLSEHIAQFSLAGIQQYRSQAAKDGE